MPSLLPFAASLHPVIHSISQTILMYITYQAPEGSMGLLITLLQRPLQYAITSATRRFSPSTQSLSQSKHSCVHFLPGAEEWGVLTNGTAAKGSSICHRFFPELLTASSHPVTHSFLPSISRQNIYLHSWLHSMVLVSHFVAAVRAMLGFSALIRGRFNAKVSRESKTDQDILVLYFLAFKDAQIRYHLDISPVNHMFTLEIEKNRTVS